MSLKTLWVNAMIVKNTFALVLFNPQSTGSLTRDTEDIHKKCLRMTILSIRCINTRGTNI